MANAQDLGCHPITLYPNNTSLVVSVCLSWY